MQELRKEMEDGMSMEHRLEKCRTEYEKRTTHQQNEDGTGSGPNMC